MENEMQTTVVEAIDLTYDALGVCKMPDGYTVFVEDMLKGEKARIAITNWKKSYGFGVVVERIERSPFRVTPKCVHFYECGGCGLMHMEYDVQTSFKKYRLETVLRHEGLGEVPVRDTVTMLPPYNYRNKVEIKFAQGEKGIEAGFFQAKSHHVVNLKECHIMGKRTFDVLVLIKNLANEFGIQAYSAHSRQGILKSAVIRESHATRKLSVLFQTAHKPFPEKDAFVKKLVAKIPEIESVGISLTDDESMLSASKIELLYGPGYLVDKLNDLEFEIGFRSFFQTNTLQTEKLYEIASDYAKFSGKEKVIDAYCGIGAIGLSIAKDVFKVFGIEVVRPAILDARKNAERNNIANAFFEVGTAETVIHKWKKYKFDVVFVDPPRKGCDREFLDALLAMKVKKIVYISCDPATLARDLRILSDGGYHVEEVTPVDMFPQTTHVESVTLLSYSR